MDFNLPMQQTVAMLMQPERAAAEQGLRLTEIVEERDIDGVPLLESEPIDFSRAGGGLSVPVDMVAEGEDGVNLDGEPLEVYIHVHGFNTIVTFISLLTSNYNLWYSGLVGPIIICGIVD